VERNEDEETSMGKKEFMKTFARLQAVLAINDARLMSNPKPYLENMAKQCNELLAVLHEVEYALSPDCAFDFWDAHADKKAIPRPTDLQGEALIRCNKALEVLRKYNVGER
jgi:hypothetical protein